jgi:hypothetical protein
MNEYNVFLAWSGNVSKAVAEAWHEWLPLAIQGAKPWMSSTDIHKGTPWFSALADQLKGIKIGIICVAPDNLSAPSIHFEAGALSRTVAEQQYVCPYLFSVKVADLGFPLAQFQATKAERDDTKELFHTLHHALGTAGLTKEQLDTIFDKWWPDLERKLEVIKGLESGRQPPHRTQPEILEELLELVRGLARTAHTEKEALRHETSHPSPELMEDLARLMHRLRSQESAGSAAARILGGPKVEKAKS